MPVVTFANAISLALVEDLAECLDNKSAATWGGLYGRKRAQDPDQQTSLNRENT
jgi:hypothetical protein